MATVALMSPRPVMAASAEEIDREVDGALQQLYSSEPGSWGVGPSIVVLDVGKAKTLTTTTLQDDVYAVIFGQ